MTIRPLDPPNRLNRETYSPNRFQYISPSRASGKDSAFVYRAGMKFHPRKFVPDNFFPNSFLYCP
jgi:hypothetical protein